MKVVYEKIIVRIKKNVNAVTNWTGKQSILNIHHRLLKFIKVVTIGFFVSTLAVVLLYRFVPVYVTPLMVIRYVEGIGDANAPKVRKEWVPIEQISPNLVCAVVASEDNKFLTHFGFDFEAIKQARKLNKGGKKIYGASTISQQTAKNVFLWPSRSWIRKGFESYFTLLIEIFWPKKRIMEVYLNVAEMGNGIYGAQSAAQFYYKKPASQLNAQQAAMIAACLPSPRKYNPANPTSYLNKRQSKINKLMKLIGPIQLDVKKDEKTKEKKQEKKK